MPTVMKLKDDSVHTLFLERDFEELIDKHRGWEAARYFYELRTELEDLREEVGNADEDKQKTRQRF